MGFNGSIPGAARLHLVDGVALLRPKEQVFTAMLTGFANQQLARNLARTTVEGRENTVKAFAAYVNSYPWHGRPAMVNEWDTSAGPARTVRCEHEAPARDAARTGPSPDFVPSTAPRSARSAETTLLQLGEPASPVPAPVATPLMAYIADRDNMNTATNQASRWLFPGRRAGRPARPDHLSSRLREIGIPVAAARGAATRQQLLELPAPVVAGALGYHDKTTSRLVRERGGPWSRYAAGDHLRSPCGWTPSPLTHG